MLNSFYTNFTGKETYFPSIIHLNDGKTFRCVIDTLNKKKTS